MEKENAPAKKESLISIGDLFQKSWEIYKKRAATFLGILIIPFLFYGLLALLYVPSGIFFSILFLAGKISIFWLIILGIILAIGMITINIWPSLALIYAIKETEKNVGVKESFTQTKNKIIPALWISFLLALALVVGYLFFIIPGILISIWFTFIFYVLIEENLRGTKVFSRSRKLVEGYWWQVFLRTLIIVLISFVSNILIDDNFVRIVFGLFLSSFSPVYYFLIYQNLKKIKAK